MSIIPGEQVARQAANAAAHFGEASAAHARSRQLDSEALVAAAAQDPGVVKSAERAKTHRTLAKVGGALAALSIVSYGAWQAFDKAVDAPVQVADAIGEGLSDVADAVKPKELSIIDVQTKLSSLGWDETEGLLAGNVSAQGHLHTEKHLIFFNQPGGQSETYSYRLGELGLSAQDVENRPEELGPNNFQAHAVFDPKDLVVKLSGVTSGPNSPAYNGIVRSLVGGIFGTNDGARQQILNDVTDKVMEQKCVENFEPAVEASIKHRLRQELEKQRDLFLAVGDEVGVRAFNSMLANPIIVETTDGTPIDQIDLQSLARPIDSKESIALAIDSDPEYTQLTFDNNGGTTVDCQQTAEVTKQIIALVNEEDAKVLKLAEIQKRVSRFAD